MNNGAQAEGRTQAYATYDMDACLEVDALASTTNLPDAAHRSCVAPVAAAAVMYGSSDVQ